MENGDASEMYGLLQKETDTESKKNELVKQMQRNSVSCGVRTHAQLPAVDLKSAPLTTRAN